MKQTVNTTPAQQIDLTHTGRLGGVVYLQNLGTGDVYVDTHSDVTIGTGLKIAAGALVGPLKINIQSLYAVASADGQDLRILLAG